MSEPPTVYVHEQAIVESDDVGEGTRVWAFAHVMKGAVVGAECNIGGGSFIESGAVVGNRVTIKNNSLVWHGVTIEDDVFVGPNTVFTNDLTPRAHRPSNPDEWLPTLVQEGATIGANSTIVCGLSIGRHAMVGAGAVVVRNVPSHALVVGNPAQRVGWMCICGARLSAELTCANCSRVYERAGDALELHHGA